MEKNTASNIAVTKTKKVIAKTKKAVDKITKALLIDIKSIDNSIVKKSADIYNNVSRKEYILGVENGIKGYTNVRKYMVNIFDDIADDDDAEFGVEYPPQIRKECIETRYYLQKIGLFEGSNIVHGKRISPRTRILSGESFPHYHFNSSKPFETPYEGHVPREVYE